MLHRHIRKNLQYIYIYKELKHPCIVLKIPYKKLPPIKIKFLLKKPKSYHFGT